MNFHIEKLLCPMHDQSGPDAVTFLSGLVSQAYMKYATSLMGFAVASLDLCVHASHPAYCWSDRRSKSASAHRVSTIDAATTLN